MHEMSLSEGMLRIIEEEAHVQAFARVRTVRLEIGALAPVEPESLRFCFDAVTRGSVAEGARLELLTPPGQGWCYTCGRAVVIEARCDPCPLCAGHNLKVTGGEEMRILELEVE